MSPFFINFNIKIMGSLCESEKNKKEGKNNETENVKPTIEAIIDGIEPTELDPCMAYVSKSFCKISAPGIMGSGFLIKLYKDQQDFFCLMTCGHVIKKDMIERKIKINFYYDSIAVRLKVIELNENERYINNFSVSNDDLDITVIEILPKDKISPEFFLSPNLNYIYDFDGLKNKEIAILEYPEGKLSQAYGVIKNIDRSAYEFSHTASTKKGASGSPIFLKNTFEVIGIHKMGDPNNSLNYGNFIGPIFNFFKNFSENKQASKNKMTSLYDIKQYPIIRIFGDKFVENNKNNCYLLINEEQRELKSILNRNEINVENKILKIILIEKKTITDMNNMFYYGEAEFNSTLISLPDISEWDTINVKNMSYMFYNCIALKSLPDISKWNTANVTNMSYMFYNCMALKSLPDISKWNTANVTNMSHIITRCPLESLPDISKWNITKVTNMSGLFSGFRSLISLSDISKWNTTNVKDMSYMFAGCSLESLPDISKWTTINVNNMSNMFAGGFAGKNIKSWPDISKWNTINVKDMSSMFENCESLISLPNISKWNTMKVNDMNNIFHNCKSLITLPDISKWNTTNVTNMYGIFKDCKSLKALPDISKWNIKKVINMGGIFEGCESLISLPDISNWNTTNVNNMSFMFAGCESLISFPDISNWNTTNVETMAFMFYHCRSLISLPDISKWNTANVTSMSYMFAHCSHSLKSFPDISKWNVTKVTDINGMFSYCKSSILPDLSKWKVNINLDSYDMF